jgi:toxin CcdB
MRQFCVYRNLNAATRAVYPLLLNVQSDLISETGTRVVVPMMRADRGMPAMPPLVPTVPVKGKAHVLVTPLLAGAELADLGALEADLSEDRGTIMAALDLLISGI